MEKEIKALSKALENLLVAVLGKATRTIVVDPAPVVHAPKNVVEATPIASAPPVVPVVPAPVQATPVAPGPVTHDQVRALLLPIIQSDQGAMTAVHSVLTQQFKVNELTSLPVASIPEFMAAVNQALEAA